MAAFETAELLDGPVGRDLEAELEAAQPQGGSSEDYWVGVNPAYLAIQRPDLLETSGDITGPGLDVEDPIFQAALADSPLALQENMLQSRGNEHALKMYQAWNIRQGALDKIANDSLGMQLTMGVIPAVFTPTNLAPVSTIAGSIYKIGKASSLLAGAGRTAVIGSVAGGVGNAADEVLFDMQNLQTDYVGATTMGILVGGGAGFLGGTLAAGNKAKNAEFMRPESDTLEYDIMKDPDLVFTVDRPGDAPRANLKPQGQQSSKETLQAKGSTSTERQHNMLLDNPLLGWLNSDIIKAYGSHYNSVRTLMTKLVAPTSSLRDSNGMPIAIGKTADEFRRERHGVYGRTQVEIVKLYTNAVKDKSFKGSAEDFVREVSDVYHKAANDQELSIHADVEYRMNKFDNEYGNAEYRLLQDEAAKALEEGRPVRQIEDIAAEAEAFRVKQRNAFEKQAREEAYSKNDGKFVHKSEAIVKGAEAYRAFFNNHLEMNKKLDMTGTRHTDSRKLYMPKTIDFNNFKQDVAFQRQFKADVKDALRGHRGNRDLSPEELELIADSYVQTISMADFKQLFTSDSFAAPNLPANSRLANRKFRFDESYLKKYRSTDLGELSGNYSYQMSGRQGLVFGTGTEDIGSVMGKLRQDMLDERGAIDEAAVKQIENTLLDISGKLRMNALSGEPGWRLTRGVTAFQSARLGVTFGGNQIVENVGSIFLGGIGKVLGSGRFGKAWKESGKLLYDGSKEADDFSQLLVDVGLLQDALANERVNRTADIELGLTPGKLEKGLHGFNSWMYKWNGLRYFKSVMEDFVGAGAMREVMDLSKMDVISNAQAARLARWGLNGDSTRKLGSELDEAFVGGKLDLTKLSDEGKDMLQLVIQRSVTETVIQGDTLHLPNWMKVPSKFRTLATQFLRFPIVAHTVLLRRGFSEDAARGISGSAGMLFMAMGMKYLREQASVAAGFTEEYDTKYDYFSKDERRRNEATQRGVMYGVNLVAPLGMLATLTSIGSGQLAGNDLLSDYKGVHQVDQLFGPSYSMVKKTLKVAQNYLGEETMTSRQVAQEVRTIVPLTGIPVFNEGLKNIIDEVF